MGTRRATSLGLLAAALLPCARPAAASGRVIRVAPGSAVPTVAAAAAQAGDGDTVEIAAGDYPADVATWAQARITVRAVGGRVRLLAQGASAGDKALWVMRGGEMRAERIDFIGARVRDRNGAGIRLERGRLTVHDCGFFDNQNGILTGNDPSCELRVEDSEFGHNGAGDGYSHGLYAGHIGRLTLQGCYFHHGRAGHLLKSRAATSQVRYCRFTDEPGGQSSYELEFPNGGDVLVLGCVIQQSAGTRNPVMLAYGLEGPRWPRNELQLVHNTWVDDRRPGGEFLRVRPGAGAVQAQHNLLVGRATLEAGARGDFSLNLRADRRDLADPDRQDYRLREDAAVLGRAAAQTLPLVTPEREYVHPRSTQLLTHPPQHPGALQSTVPR